MSLFIIDWKSNFSDGRSFAYFVQSIAASLGVTFMDVPEPILTATFWFKSNALLSAGKTVSVSYSLALPLRASTSSTLSDTPPSR